MDDSTLSTCVPGDNVLDSAELINSELKCLDRWLKSNKISISYNKNVNFPDIRCRQQYNKCKCKIKFCKSYN